MKANILFALTVAAGALAACSEGTQGTAQSVGDFYRGKTIQLTVGSATGAGYDAYGRALARFMSKHIPGNPTIVVQNMPAASSLQAVRYLMSAPKDGTQLLLFNRALINLAVTDPAAVGVNFKDFTWIGSMAGDVGVCYVSSNKGTTDARQLKGKDIRIGETSKNGGTYMFSAIAKNLFGTQQVMGYGTNAQVWLAVDRGEVDGNCTGWTSIRIQRPQWIDEKKINVLVQYSTRKHPDLQNVPTIYDFDLTPDQRRAIEFLTTADAIVRPIIAPKETPADRAAALREAFMQTMKDPEFLKYTEQIDMDIDPLGWQDVEKIVDAISSASPETVALARKITE